MDFEDSLEEADFRAELQSWLRQNARPLPREGSDGERRLLAQEWHQQLHAAGFMGLSWPVEYGGRGLPMIYEAILNEEVGRAGAQKVPSIGYLGRAISIYGTEHQKRRFLGPLLDGSVIWAQGFSEPNAGSDLASMSTRAIRDGDNYIVNGQKMWGSAHLADWQLALVRTDPDAPKHQGISCLVLELSSPGIDARPVVMFDGEADLSEVFYTDVVVPVDQRVGKENQGWQLAMSVLAYERAPADIGNVSVYERMLGELDTARREGRLRAIVGLDIGLERANMDVAILRHHVKRSLSARGDQPPGPEGSIDKLLMIRVEQALLHFIMDVIGVEPLTGQSPESFHDYCWARAASIYGGTQQIQKNIVAQRVLGLPRSA